MKTEGMVNTRLPVYHKTAFICRIYWFICFRVEQTSCKIYVIQATLRICFSRRVYSIMGRFNYPLHVYVFLKLYKKSQRNTYGSEIAELTLI